MKTIKKVKYTVEHPYKHKYLILGKIYEVVNETDSSYTIVDEEGDNLVLRNEYVEEVEQIACLNIQRTELLTKLEEVDKKIHMHMFVKDSWYENKEGEIACYQSGDSGYGFNKAKTFLPDVEWGFYQKDFEWKPLRNTEKLESLLRHETHKRYNAPTPIIYLDGNGKIDELRGLDLTFMDNKLYASHYSEDVVFDNGKWAEIPKATLPNIRGYKGVDTGENIKYGCATLNYEWFLPSDNRQVAELTLTNGVVISKSEVRQIADYLSKK